MTTPSTERTIIRVNIPSALRPFTENERAVDLTGQTVGQVLQNLAERYPNLTQHLFDADGAVRSFVSVFLGDEDIRHLDGASTPVLGHTELSIVPSIAGGAGRGSMPPPTDDNR